MYVNRYTQRIRNRIKIKTTCSYALLEIKSKGGKIIPSFCTYNCSKRYRQIQIPNISTHFQVFQLK